MFKTLVSTLLPCPALLKRDILLFYFLPFFGAQPRKSISTHFLKKKWENRPSHFPFFSLHQNNDAPLISRNPSALQQGFIIISKSPSLKQTLQLFSFWSCLVDCVCDNGNITFPRKEVSVSCWPQTFGASLGFLLPTEQCRKNKNGIKKDSYCFCYLLNQLNRSKVYPTAKINIVFFRSVQV